MTQIEPRSNQGILLPQASGSGAGGSEGGGNPWELLNDRLRGRWKFVLPLALVLGIVASVIGYTIAPVKYVSRGHVVITPKLKPIVKEIPETEPLAFYDDFVATQAQILESDQLIERAMRHPDVAGAGFKASVSTVSLFANGLDVIPPRRGNAIVIAYEADTPDLAYAGMRAVLEEYEREFSPETDFEQSMERLIQERTEIESRLQQLRNQRQEEAERLPSPYNLSTLEEQYRTRSTWQNELYRELEEMRRWSCAGDDQGGTGQSGQNSDLTDDTVDTVDPVSDEASEPTYAELEKYPDVQAARARLRRITAQLEEARTALGPEASLIKELERKLNAAEDHVARIEAAARERWRSEQAMLDPSSADPASIAERISWLESRIEQFDAEFDALDDVRLEIQRIDDEIEGEQQSLEEVRQRIKGLETEREEIIAGRISVRPGIRPSSPGRDKRKQLAILGFMGGFAAPFGLFFLLGTIDRRAYAAAQLGGRTDPYDCLGVIPDLAAKATSEELDPHDTARQCVHRLRNRIELLRRPGRGFVVAVSSPFQGDGKTSLVYALAWSYASSGHRTIIVDCDFLGRALTSQVGRNDRVGVKEALRSGHLNGEVADMPQANLSVLSVGRDASYGPEAVRYSHVQHLFDQLREMYEIVIVDTGPLLGSVEAMPVASAADGVVLTLRRGRPTRRLEEAIEELGKLGAQFLGVVLNCAASSDCRRYASTSAYRTSRSDVATRKSGRAPQATLFDAVHGVAVDADAPQEDGREP